MISMSARFVAVLVGVLVGVRVGVRVGVPLGVGVAVLVAIGDRAKRRRRIAPLSLRRNLEPAAQEGGAIGDMVVVADMRPALPVEGQ